MADTTVFEQLLARGNTSSNVYARSRLPIRRTGGDTETSRLVRAYPAQGQRNRRIATPRACIEHVFGALAQMGGKLVRCMGSVHITFALHLKAASYNLKRLVFLKGGGLAPF